MAGACLATAGLLASVAAPAGWAAAPGELDHTFGTNGKVVTAFNDSTDSADAVAIDSAGRAVTVGLASVDGQFDFAVARHRADGTLDPAFGGDGTVTTAVGRACDWARAVAIDGRGRIVVAGLTVDVDRDGRCPTGTYHFALARYLPDGSLDREFGTDGKVITPMGSTGLIDAVLIDGQDRIVAVGTNSATQGTGSIGFTERFALARYRSDGELDPQFGAGGRVFTSIGVLSFAYDAALDAQGRIVAAGLSCEPDPAWGCKPDAAVVRYRGDGSLDGTFGDGGIVETALAEDPDTNPSMAEAVAVDRDGRIVVAGSAGSFEGSVLVLARYLPTGMLDSGFGSGGIVRSFIGTSSVAHDVALDPAGRIVAVGEAATAAGRPVGIALARYGPGGGLDESFGDAGVVTTTFEEWPVAGDGCCPGAAVGMELAHDRESRIVVGGYAWNGRDLDFALARYGGGERPPAADSPPADVPEAGASPPPAAPTDAPTETSSDGAPAPVEPPPGSGGGEPVGRDGPPSDAGSAPQLRVESAARQRLSAVLRGGLRTRAAAVADCPCRLHYELKLDPRSARRMGLRRTIGRARRTFETPTRLGVVVRLTRAARRALTSAPRLSGWLEVTLTDRVGRTVTRRHRLRLYA